MEDSLLQAVYDQKEELTKYSINNQWLDRIQETYINTNSKLAQIVIGVRRSGKSTLAHRALANQNYGYLNFDDERLAEVNSEELNLLLQHVYKVYGEIKFLFLDEIQNVENWNLFVNRLLRNDLHVIITGSNSKLLSSELATHLTGRYSKIELFPFSFKEFVQFKKIATTNLSTKNKGLLQNAFDEYTTKGGFPEIIKGENPESYIKSLFDSIVTKDIFYRHSIKYTKTFKDVALYLIDNFGHEISYNRIKKIFGLGSENTTQNYVSYLEEAYLTITLQKFSFKKQESLRYRKVYLVDTAFAAVLANKFLENKGFLLENIVFLELLRNRDTRQTEIYYYKQLYEVDFVIVKNRNVEELIQVSMDLDNPKTLNREVRALLNASSELRCNKLTIISENRKEQLTINEQMITIIPIMEWLLS